MGDVQVPRILTLRCRYCNKAISLLRRINDAEYCSDSHRFADAEEQQLAMRRLAETQPAMQRTQRMAAARTSQRGGGGQTAVVEPVSVSTVSMTFAGEALPFLPPPSAAGSRLFPCPDALACAPTVFFRDREHTFQSGMPLVSRLAQLPIGTASPAKLAAAVVGQLAQFRIVFPRELSSKPSQRGKWDSSRTDRLSVLVVPPLPSPRPTGKEPTIIPAISLRWMNGPKVRREHELPAESALLNIPNSAIKAAGSASHKSNELPLLGEAKVSLPRAHLSTLAAETPAPVDDSAEDLWAILGDTPLTPSLPTAPYTTIFPISAAFGGLLNSKNACSVSFPGAPAAIPCLLAGPRPVHPPIASALCRVEAPHSPCNAPSATALAIVPLPTSMVAVAGHRCPERKALPAPRNLSSSSTVLPVPRPILAAGDTAARWSGDWETTALSPGIRPLPALHEHYGLRSAIGLAVPPLTPSCAVPSALHYQTWLPAETTLAKPGACLAAITGQPALAPQVAHIPCPDPVQLPHVTESLQTLQTVLRVRLPRRSVAPASRFGASYNGDKCIPLHPPALAATLWRPDIVAGPGLCPAPILPSPAKSNSSRGLRRLPIRLFQVPGAKPMARPLGGKPLSYPMGLWASRPLIRSPFIDFDDGKHRPKHLSPQQLGRELRERFSQQGLRAFWTKFTYLPSDLKWIAMVVPLIVGIWALARPSSTGSEATPQQVAHQVEPAAELPEFESKAAVAAVTSARPANPRTPTAEKNSRPAKLAPAPDTTAWGAFTARIASRASVDFEEDFHNGLSLWDGKGEWARSWSYDRAGTVRPGQMAIYQPSVGLRDYVFEMKAAIDRRSIQWIVRASNPQNYHFARLNVTPGAPLTKLELERWTVVNGRAGRVTRLPLPHASANQTLYAIRVETRGDSVTTYLQDQVIDTFNDARLQDGGVGLLGTGDDRPRIYGIRVFYQNDFLGKLCSFLAPPPITSQGSE